MDIFLASKYKMIDNLSLIEIMELPLPKISVQKRLPYRPDIDQVIYAYDLLNRDVFSSILTRPMFNFVNYRNVWGECTGKDKLQKSGSYCIIGLSNRWYCPQWMVMTIAHEMCHQYQWDVYSKDRKNKVMSHGPSFYHYQMKLREHKIPLKSRQYAVHWFKRQDFFNIEK